jgi:class 3 adenylate cyclase/tetratricopeptide (TPR) repeat protein
LLFGDGGTKSNQLLLGKEAEKIQKYLPHGLVSKVLSQKEKIEGERKQVTVMFCDMEGFTPLVEALGPEESYSIMDQVYEILIHKVRDYDGTVNEMTGDGVMALFGAPVALEDAPQRSIRSAFAIHREMALFSDKMRKERPELPPLKMRVGIHCGPVVVGSLGNDLRVEFKAVGDTVNLASRMEGLADPGTTYVSDDMFKLTEGFFRFEALGEKEIKGKKEPVNVFRVVAPSTQRTRFDVSTERGLTPFVGRQRELELLMEGFERSKSGRGQAYFILAEAGVGKSRLLYEFRKAVANEDVNFLEGKCLSFSHGIAYHPIIDALKSNFDVREEADDSEIIERIKKGLKILKVDEAPTLPYLLKLLSVEDSGVDKISMSPEAMKDRIIEAVKRIFLKDSEIRPMIVTIEDLHWIDKSSEECLKALLDSIAGSRIFLIFTYRPKYVHTWGAKSYYNQISLNRLSNGESLALVTHLLSSAETDKELHDLTLEKTEGVPFFIEEFIKSLMDLKIIEKKNNTYQMAKSMKAVAIPSTIQDVIMARVDLLPEGSKKLIQIGSVIEREFSYELIKRVTGLTQDELLSALSVLKDSELIYERGLFPQSNFIFKHALTREVVYKSILAKKRKKLHKEIGNAIEELYEDDLSEHCELLVEHYFLSEDYSKAADYSKMAVKKAEKNVSLNEAAAYAAKRVTALEKMPETKSLLRQIIAARTGLGLYMFQLFHFAEAKEAVEPIFKSAIDIGYTKRVAQIYTIMGSYSCWIKEDFNTGIKQLEIAKDLAVKINDVVSGFFSNQWLGFAYAYCCDFKKAGRHFKKALKINIETGNIWGTSVVMGCISHWVLNYNGLIAQGYKMSHNALETAIKSGDIYSKAVAYTLHGASLYFKGENETAEEYLLKGAALNSKIGFKFVRALAHFFLGHNYYQTGELHTAKANYRQTVEILEGIQCLPSMANLCRICISLINAKKLDVRILKQLKAYVSSNEIIAFEGWMLRKIGKLTIGPDRKSAIEAEHWVKKAIQSDERNGTQWQLAKDYALYSKILEQLEQGKKAKHALLKSKMIDASCQAG